MHAESTPIVRVQAACDHAGFMDDAEARIGGRLGNYWLRGIIGRGGMGVVYRGEHVYLQKQVAVKVLNSSYFDQPDARDRFLREAQTAGVIEHPNIVGVTDFGEAEDGAMFLVMAHVQGVSLEQVLQTEQRLPLFRTLVILSQVTRALQAAHDKDIIHHDLKPENIMLRPRAGRREVVRDLIDARGTLELVEREGSYDFVTVLDFGAAKFLDQAAAGAGVVVGTPAYMAPETARIGVADARSDIYAVGILFYEMLTGSPPFDDADPVNVMMKQVQDPPPPPRERCPDAEITHEAERTILRALQKDPALRHQTMGELHSDIQRCYGSVRFRRTMQILPDGMPAETMRKPIPLTNVKGRPTPPTPVPAVPAEPILLTRRKSGRHKTLPFGPATPEPEALPVAKPRR
jgi:serine/threonine protein kinase